MKPEKEIGIVKAWMAPQLEEGVECPCCNKMCKLYGRKVNSGMAHLLIRVYQKSPHDWIYISRLKHIKSDELGVVNGDFTYLQHWGLLERKPQDGGVWKLTQLGRRFVEGTATVPKTVFLLNNKCVGRSDEQTNIKVALGNHFDYDELMNPVGLTS